MKVILQQEVKKLGKKGEIIEVSEGYARNYLLAQKLAIPATASNVNNASQQKASEERKLQRALDEANLLAAQMAKVEVTIGVKMGEGGKLFGSVASKDIADALLAQHKIEMDKRKIDLKDAIKSLGTYPVSIKLHPEVSAKIQVHIIAK
ncbi:MULTISPECIES: 50S ribosomal protein L9 [unclassified Pelosinus]|jgi:large subunit ribosomal protein L9|uniref:50S ribosomal protein L9 n=1 Tax=unclassified Pelosinus TaxID=2629460 RepID=UPI0004D1482D|nr:MULTISPECIES: 50S ribosomal protein L9 [unclassified Pelosinus]AIF54069.1 50S ribosomal protein L9 [Pelosinus sp. UFO1]GMB00108.1 50S ribosomal protein L9 [Pelosinus sp. IPA-1]